MGIMDIFKANENQKLNEKNKRLEDEIEKIKSTLSPENLQYLNILKQIEVSSEKKNKLESNIILLNLQIKDLDKKINDKKQDLIILDDEILMQDFGLYTPMYGCTSSEEYKHQLDFNREKQKVMIKNKTTVNYFKDWSVNGSKKEGEKMTNNNIKQIILTFNIECENIIEKIKFNNYDSMKKRIEKSFDNLNKINKINKVCLTPEFLSLKIEELNLVYEYQAKKQEEKEEQRHIREELREQAKLQKELEEAKKNTDKDLKHFNNALNDILEQLENDTINKERKHNLLEKKQELEKQIETLNHNLQDIDYRQSNQKAGYVYVISNIGSFGENIYKIGMTRRLNPQDRIDELGDASVPFRFDVHTMIFSEDAPMLERILHKTFENKKLNMINQRREFFNVSLEEIEEVIKNNFDKTVEFKRIPEAGQYRESIKIKENLNV